MTETPYAETEILLAYMDEDDARLDALIREMLNSELTRFRQQVEALAWALRQEQMRRDLLTRD